MCIGSCYLPENGMKLNILKCNEMVIDLTKDKTTFRHLTLDGIQNIKPNEKLTNLFLKLTSLHYDLAKKSTQVYPLFRVKPTGLKNLLFHVF
jgi:hypothetical protein